MLFEDFPGTLYFEWWKVDMTVILNIIEFKTEFASLIKKYSKSLISCVSCLKGKQKQRSECNSGKLTTDWRNRQLPKQSPEFFPIHKTLKIQTEPSGILGIAIKKNSEDPNFYSVASRNQILDTKVNERPWRGFTNRCGSVFVVRDADILTLCKMVMVTICFSSRSGGGGGGGDDDGGKRACLHAIPPFSGRPLRGFHSWRSCWFKFITTLRKLESLFCAFDLFFRLVGFARIVQVSLETGIWWIDTKNGFMASLRSHS